MKILLFIILILVIAILILIIDIQLKNKKYEKLNNSYKNLEKDFESAQHTCDILKEENEIEIKQKNELAAKLADISRMSIDDILQQLQHD